MPRTEKIPVGTRTDVFMVRHFLSPEECLAEIRRSEQHGYEEAAISTPLGQVVAKRVRNNDRILWDDPLKAADWWERSKPFVPPAYGKWQAYGLNERFRFYRYSTGQTFKRHQDGTYRRARGDESWWTLLVYLNAGFTGGRTRFWFANSEEVVIEPEVGLALFFLHERSHEGEIVENGVKYVLRTDVMYHQV